MPLNYFHQNGQWKLKPPVFYKIHQRIIQSARRNDLLFDTIIYTLVLERQPVYYVIVVMIPCAMFGILAIVTFGLPLEGGERVSFSTAILLSQVLELLVLADILPPADKEKFPLLGKYVLSQVMAVALSVIMTVALQCVYQTPASKPMPQWLSKIAQKLKPGLASFWFCGTFALPHRIITLCN